ncbi:MAG: hypothetical protein JW955_01315 [Sedimentisphaerales bacterium]|nr:hypothetical protein [Sedimentisphaerales bacterium]
MGPSIAIFGCLLEVKPWKSESSVWNPCTSRSCDTSGRTIRCKLHKNEYATPKSPVLVTVGEATYLTVCGRGEPGGLEFTDRIVACSRVHTVDR